MDLATGAAARKVVARHAPTKPLPVRSPVSKLSGYTVT